MCDHGFGDVPLPSGWAKNVKSAVLHVISVAQFVLARTRRWTTITYPRGSSHASSRLSSHAPRQLIQFAGSGPTPACALWG